MSPELNSTSIRGVGSLTLLKIIDKCRSHRMDIQNDNPTPLIVLREIIMERETFTSDTTSAAEISSFMTKFMIGGETISHYWITSLNIRTDGFHGNSADRP